MSYVFSLHSRWKIKDFTPQIRPAYRHKLLALGLLPDEVFCVQHIAPLGDPIHIRTEKLNIALRRKDLAFLQLTPLGDEA